MIKIKMKRVILIVLAGFILGTAIVVLANPLRKSEERIRKDMLEIFPVGTEMNDVIKTVNNNKDWEIGWINEDSGYGIGPAGIPGEGYTTTIGETSMRIYIGEYRYSYFFVADVVVYLGFDEDAKLIDLAVRKYIDSP